MLRTRLCITVVLLAHLSLYGQIPPGATSVFDFDNGNVYDWQSGQKAYLHSAVFTDDRFGKAESAVYFHGNKYSFIKIPPAILNKEAGSISLWFNMHGIMGLGEGVDSNPIFSIRSHESKDCNDGIYIGVDMNTRKLNGASLNSCKLGMSLYSKAPIELAAWHHVVLTYDYGQLALYLNGDLQFSGPRGFRTQLAEGDSILLGVRSSKGNERYFLGCIDDLVIYDRVVTPVEVRQLYNAGRNELLRWTLIISAVLATSAIVVLLIKYRVRILVAREKKKDLVHKMWLEQENKVLSAQMDPHFVFNSLNTIQHLIVAGDNEKAQHYLSQFAKLIRRILETNVRESITLKEEIGICEKYLEIEAIRFNQVFSYRIDVDPSLEPEAVRMPHFMLQPVIENAIWHGLLQKEGPKELVISFAPGPGQSLCCVVEDNGIGREAAAGTQSFGARRRSLATQFIQQRLSLYSRLNGGQYYIKITDKRDNGGFCTGTRVELSVPVIDTLEEHETSHYN